MPGSRTIAAVFACLLALAGCCPSAKPLAAAPKPALDCTKPSLTGAVALPASPSGPITGGTFSSQGPITLGSSGPQFDLAKDLVIWSDDDLVVDGDIDLPYAATVGASSINITLGAKKKVIINGHVGGGRAAPVAVTSGTAARGLAGVNGGYIKVVAGTVDIQGRVDSNGGGWGGDARAIGIVAAAWGGLTTSGGEAEAIAGTGGSGGDVILCGDLIIVRGSITGASGGRGGTGTAVAAAGHDACGCGGDGGLSGDVIFGPASRIDIPGAVWAGTGWWAGDGIASVSPADGGSAVAFGGAGAPGGSVIFRTGAVVITKPPPTTSVISGNGSIGGDAGAAGGDGANGRHWPDAGGKASATGGAGGKFGPTPKIPLPSGGTVDGTNGASRQGGDATAVGGDGGTNTTGGTGANSGSATAKGGSNGNGFAATGGTTTAGPAIASGPAGATGPTAAQAGAP